MDEEVANCDRNNMIKLVLQNKFELATLILTSLLRTIKQAELTKAHEKVIYKRDWYLKYGFFKYAHGDHNCTKTQILKVTEGSGLGKVLKTSFASKIIPGNYIPNSQHLNADPQQVWYVFHV